MVKTTAISVSAIATFVLLLSSCSASVSASKSGASARPTEGRQRTTFATVADAAASAKQHGYESQYALLQDNDASKSDYEEALQQAVTCMTQKGVVVQPLTVNRLDGLTYNVSSSPEQGMAPDNAAQISSTCFWSKSAYVEVAYRLTHTQAMDPALLAGTQNCLKQKGVRVTGSEKNVPDLLKSVGTDDIASPAGQKILDCADSVNQSLYPGTSISYAD